MATTLDIARYIAYLIFENNFITNEVMKKHMNNFKNKRRDSNDFKNAVKVIGDFYNPKNIKTIDR